MERTASCACGKLGLSCSGEPLRISICHCLECWRRTGSPLSYNATYPAEQVQAAGSYKSFVRSSEEGFWVKNHFCPECGTTVFYEIQRRPGMVSVPVGGFADPSFPEPKISVYEERCPDWLRVTTSAPIDGL